MPIYNIRVEPYNYSLDIYHIDRWMCSRCGYILDYQFDDDHPGWPKYEPEPNSIVHQWIDEDGQEHIETVSPDEVTAYCPRCGLDIDSNQPIKIRVTPFQDIADITPLVNQGEGVSLDFKLQPPRPEKLGKIIVSFANTLGGKIIIGIDDEGNIKGYSEITSPKGKDIFQQFVKSSLSRAHPKIDIRIDFLTDSNITIAIITIPKGNNLYMYENIPYIRELESSRPATSEEVTRIVLERERDR